ncbi:MAG: geranylgeranylglycerol-phosphate geranylgeranyltransferase [Sphingomonadales bacterium]
MEDNKKPAFRYYWILLRPVNLGIIILTMGLFMMHASKWNVQNLRWPDALFVLLAILFTAAAGYVINDILDIEEDIINKPEKRIITKHISINAGLVFYGLLLILSIVFGFLTGLSMGLVCVLISVLLYFYSSDLKGTTLWGSILVSLMNGVVVFFSAQGVDEKFNGYFAEYAFLAFLITLAREIVKDIEDIEGDKTREYETFPIVYGAKKSVWLSMAILTLLNIHMVYLITESKNLYFGIFSAVFVLMPVFYFYYQLLTAEGKADYTSIQKRLKWLMVSGILSVILL